MIDNEQLIGLCDEIAALVRLDIPLEAALRNRRSDLPDKLGKKVEELAGRLESGQSLSTALENDPDFPPVYAAVIGAGLESGNLAGALERISRNLRILRDSRNFLVGSTLYPMFVFTTLWFLLTWVLYGIGPVYADFYESFSFFLPGIDRLAFCREHPVEYFIGMFLVLAVLWFFYGLWYYRSSCTTFLTFRPPALFFWLRSANRNLAKATFAQVAALLIRSGMPLPRVLALALRTVGDTKWLQRGEKYLEQLPTTDGAESKDRYPDSPISPLVRWIVGVPDQSVLLSGLEQFADMNVFRAKSRLDRLELWLPVVAMFLLGGAVFAAYFLTIVFPYGYLLYRMANMTP